MFLFMHISHLISKNQSTVDVNVIISARREPGGDYAFGRS
uniref:Uncharacterized protein n=1 Tax=Anguilla anguilla TaxID=7936 RepID=A0A0E9RJ83_ANGAN